MKELNSNISSLLGSLGAQSPIDLNQYASIKNGSYRKVVKAYYAEQKAEVSKAKSSSSSAASKTKNSSKKETVDTTGLSKMKSDADGLKTSAEALKGDDIWKKTDGAFDVEKIASGVKAFADGYNAAVSQVQKVNSKEVAESAKFMTNLTGTMSNALAKIGVSVGVDGKMTVDEEAFKKADMNKVKALFNGEHSYGAEIAEKANDISKATVMNSSTYNKNAAQTSALAGLFEGWV